jgi:hypothetical protein
LDTLGAALYEPVLILQSDIFYRIFDNDRDDNANIDNSDDIGEEDDKADVDIDAI